MEIYRILRDNALLLHQCTRQKVKKIPKKPPKWIILTTRRAAVAARHGL